MLSGVARGTVFALADSSLSLGRAEENNIHLDDDDVSRHHALMVREGDEYRLRDLNSANGTFVNGHRIVEALLFPGDKIRIGLVELFYDTAPLTITSGKPTPRVTVATPPANRLVIKSKAPENAVSQPQPQPARPAPFAAPVASSIPVAAASSSPAPRVIPLPNTLPLAAPVLLHPQSQAASAAATIPVGARTRSPWRKRIWISLAVADCLVMMWLVYFVAGHRWNPLRPDGPPAVAEIQPSLAAEPNHSSAAPDADYRDSKGRFTCELPVGWQVLEDRGDARSKVRFVSGEDEMRVIVQAIDSTELQETDRQAALEVFNETIERARAAGADGKLLAAEWRTLGATRALQIELEMRPPEFLWMRQLKFRQAGLDHTLALYVATPERRNELAEVFERFLQSYRGVSQVSRPTVAAVTR